MIPAVLGDLAFVAGVYDPVLRDPNNVRHPGIGRLDTDQSGRGRTGVNLGQAAEVTGLPSILALESL